MAPTRSLSPVTTTPPEPICTTASKRFAGAISMSLLVPLLEFNLLEKAAIVRSQPRKNLGGAFEKALEDDWKAPKTSEPPKRQKYQPAIPDPPLSGKAKRAEVAQMEARLETAKARWILADADQRSAWLERMDTISRKLTPMNGSEPRRGFLLCLAAILESAREMKSTLQSSELTAGRAIAA